jgi:hypothetical protein
VRGNNGRLFFSGERPLNELTDPTRKKKKSITPNTTITKQEEKNKEEEKWKIMVIGHL